MSTDWRALCQELLDHAECAQSNLGPDGEGLWDGDEDEGLFARAREALAQPEPEAVADGPAVPEGREPASVACEPSDGDLLQLMPEQFRADLGTVSRMAAHGAGPDIKPGLFRVSLNTGALEYARAVLARWGRPAPVPAEGEVAVLLRELRDAAFDRDGSDPEKSMFTRAADLLERQAAPVPAGEVAESSVAPVPEPALAKINGILSDSGRVLLTDVREALELARQALEQRKTAPAPVPVAERLPGVEDRDHEECCWWFYPETTDTLAVWVLGPGNAEWLISNPPSPTHWLPATALPLPQGEVE